MMFKMKMLAAIAALPMAITASSAFAAPVLLTSLPMGANTTTFDVTGSTFVPSATPVTIDGFVVTNSDGAYYGNGSYGLGSNGRWNQFSLVANNSATGSITFDLGGSYGSVGAFLNYAPGFGTPLITALDASMQVIASYDLSALAPISTPNGTNDGAFRGVQDNTNDIRYLQLTGGYLLAHSVSTADVSAVPEPATWAMMILGVGAIGFAMRSAKRRSDEKFDAKIKRITEGAVA